MIDLKTIARILAELEKAGYAHHGVIPTYEAIGIVQKHVRIDSDNPPPAEPDRGMINSYARRKQEQVEPQHIKDDV